MKKGQIVFLETLHSHKKELIGTEIEDVKRKYIYTKQYGRFYKESLCHDAGNSGGYHSNYKMWLSKEDYEKEQQRLKYLSFLREEFGGYPDNDLSFDKIKQIVEIIKGE